MKNLTREPVTVTLTVAAVRSLIQEGEFTTYMAHRFAQANGVRLTDEQAWDLGGHLQFETDRIDQQVTVIISRA